MLIDCEIRGPHEKGEVREAARVWQCFSPFVYFAYCVVRFAAAWVQYRVGMGNHETREPHEKGPDREEGKVFPCASPFVWFVYFVVSLPMGWWVRQPKDMGNHEIPEPHEKGQGIEGVRDFRLTSPFAYPCFMVIVFSSTLLASWRRGVQSLVNRPVSLEFTCPLAVCAFSGSAARYTIQWHGLRGHGSRVNDSSFRDFAPVRHLFRAVVPGAFAGLTDSTSGTVRTTDRLEFPWLGWILRG